MRGDSKLYIKHEDHEREMSEQYREQQKQVERERERVKEAATRAEARGYERGMNDAWKDALALLRRLSLKDATEQIKAMAVKGKK